MTFDDLSALRVLVTGAGSGIGYAIASGALARGASVAVLDLHPSTAPSGTTGFVADVSDDDSVAAAVSAAVEHLGGLDIVINNAG
ncbi:MAG: SDR family NAD(P)-dependent oxidoreductase, partial [Ilumatobacteraceae bacterium]